MEYNAVVTPESSKSKKTPVKVWGEVGIKLSFEYNSVTYTFGHERISPDSSSASIKKTETLINELNEEVLSQRMEQYKRLVKRSLRTQ